MNATDNLRGGWLLRGVRPDTRLLHTRLVHRGGLVASQSDSALHLYRRKIHFNQDLLS